MLCRAAVHSTPGAYMRSPSAWMLTEKRPRSRFASAAPPEAGAPHPTAYPPDPPRHLEGVSHGRKLVGQVKPTPDADTRGQSLSCMGARVAIGIHAVFI